MRAEVIHGDCLDVMRTMPDASVDAVVTDPPYGLAFMGKLWDHGVPGEQFWGEALRVAKPGAALLAFGGTRTFHRLAVAIEDAGWRIYDCLSWMYGQGFPKHRTHLKPAWEPIVFASKKGARFVNVDGCRLAWRGTEDAAAAAAAAAVGFADSRARGTTKQSQSIGKESRDGVNRYNPDVLPGRWPANVVLDEEAARMLDEQSGESRSPATVGRGGKMFGNTERARPGEVNPCFGDSGGASRFFYTSKATKADREDGLEGMPIVARGMSGGAQSKGEGYAEAQSIGFNVVRHVANHHPTVKPTDLMRWLCRLVTPPGGTVLDPFCGSGSTGVAANAEGFDFIGIEREADYVEIARRRIANVAPLFA